MGLCNVVFITTLVAAAAAIEETIVEEVENVTCVKSCMRDMATAMKMFGDGMNMPYEASIRFQMFNKASMFNKEKFNSICGAYETMNNCVNACDDVPEEEMNKFNMIFRPLEYMCVEMRDEFMNNLDCFSNVMGNTDMSNMCYNEFHFNDQMIGCGEMNSFNTLITSFKRNMQQSDIMGMFQDATDACTFTECMMTCRNGQFIKTCGENTNAQVFTRFVGMFVDAIINMAKRMNIPTKVIPESCMNVAAMSTMTPEEPIVETTTTIIETTTTIETTKTPIAEIVVTEAEATTTTTAATEEIITTTLPITEPIATTTTTMATTTTEAAETTTLDAAVAEEVIKVIEEKVNEDFSVDSAVVDVVTTVLTNTAVAE